MQTDFRLDQPLMTRDEVADLLHIKRQSLDNAAWRGLGPPFFRLGRSIRYDRQHVADWLLTQTYTPPARAIA